MLLVFVTYTFALQKCWAKKRLIYLFPHISKDHSVFKLCKNIESFTVLYLFLIFNIKMHFVSKQHVLGRELENQLLFSWSLQINVDTGQTISLSMAPEQLSEDRRW